MVRAQRTTGMAEGARDRGDSLRAMEVSEKWRGSGTVSSGRQTDVRRALTWNIGKQV